jgi:hypothetical protein
LARSWTEIEQFERRDLLAGQVQVYFPTMPASIEYVRA